MTGGQERPGVREVSEQTKEFIVLAVTDPEGAADLLERKAREMLRMAEELRARAAGGPGEVRSTGGAADRVAISVVGPDGRVKQRGGNFRE